MPRKMPRFDLQLSAQMQLATSIVQAGETMRGLGIAAASKEWSTLKIEALYELAYLRVFAAWEECLESIFHRTLCGYASRAGQETLIVGRFYPTIAAAEAAVLGGYPYVLWHDPYKVITRCHRHINFGPGCLDLQASTLSSKAARLVELAAIRHRIVHYQEDARRKFDAATLSIAGMTYPHSRPGKFLRDADTSSAIPRRWLEVTTGELVSLASQMV